MNKDIAIPEHFIDEAVQRFGRKFLFTYPEKFYTDTDILDESRKPTGLRYYGICTSCGKRSDNVEPAMDEKMKFRGKVPYYDRSRRPPLGYTICPNCGRFVEARKGNLSKEGLKDEFYLKAWEPENPEKVILYEACVTCDFWQNDGPGRTEVWYQRKTEFTPGSAVTYEYWYSFGYEGKEGWVRAKYPRDASGDLPEREAELGQKELEGTFIEKIYAYVKENRLPLRYLFRFVEEPLTEIFCKMGFTGIASDRCYKSHPTKGTRHIDFTQRSPKKMFRGLDKATEQKINEVMRLVNRKDRVYCNDIELAITVMRKCRGASPEVIAALIDSEKGCRAMELCLRLSDFPVKRVAEYCYSHDLIIYRDYLDLAKLNGAPLNEVRTAFPEDLNAAHDEQNARKKYIANRENELKYRQRAEKLRDSGYEFEWNGICAVIPETAKDIQNEGAALCHCVGHLYVNAHANGSSNIIFIRRASEPAVSWFTLEVDPRDCSFRQCFGFKNKVRGLADPEVAPFLKKYQQHLRRAAKHKEDKQCQKKTA